MTRNPALHDHIATAILDAAATVLADRADAASMTEIAVAAGVGRTTLYRYFPTRDDLLSALTAAAVADLAARIADAKPDTVDVHEALLRVTRATFAAAAKYRALSHTAKDPAAADAVDRQLGAPVRELFTRGRDDGTLRADLAAETLFELYVGLLQGTLNRRLADTLGVEQAGAAVVTVFLSGAGSGPAAAR